MPTESLTREMALRIGLAARALPDASPASLLNALAELVGLPPSEERLQSLRIRDLRDPFPNASKQDLARAITCLKGETADEAIPPPPLQAALKGPNTVRVACASNSGEAMDGHFGSCLRFLIYDVNAAETRLVDIRAAEADSGAVEGSEGRATLIADCQILFVASIGGPAAAKVVKRGIHPVRVTDGGNARTVAATLSTRIASHPALWIAQGMGRRAAAVPA